MQIFYRAGLRDAVHAEIGLMPQLGDIVRPRLHKGIEELSSDEKFGESGAGLETLASGGMHSLCIDERGYVSLKPPLSFHSY